MTKPSRFFENGLDAACGGSFWVDSADSSENRTSASGLTEPSVRDAQRGVGLATADRFDAELDGGGAGGAGGRKRNRRSLGAECLRQMIGHRTEQEAAVILGRTAAAAGAQQGVVIEILSPRSRGRAPAAAATRPRPGRPRETAVRENRLCCRSRIARCASSAATSASRSVEAGRGERLDGNEIDRSGHRRLQAVDRKTRDGADAGFAGGEFLPVVGLAGAERGHDAHAGDDDDRPAGFIAWCCHVFPAARAPPCSLDRFDQGHAFAPPVTGPDHHNLGRGSGHFNLKPGGIVGRKQRAARDRQRGQRQVPAETGFPWCGRTWCRWPAPRKSAMLGQESPLFGGDRLGAGGAGDDGAAALEPCRASTTASPASPSPRRAACAAPDRRRRWSGAHRVWRRALRACALDSMTRNAPAEPSAKPACPAARPDRREFVLEVEVAEFVEHQQVLALAVLRAADQRDVALPAGDARQRDPRRVDAGGFLAHEGARGPARRRGRWRYCRPAGWRAAPGTASAAGRSSAVR